MEELLVLALGGLLGVLLKKECHICHSKLTLTKRCMIAGCRQWTCGKCGKDFAEVKHKGWRIADAGRCCDNHIDNYHAHIEASKQHVEDAEDVQIWLVAESGPKPKFNRIIHSGKFYDVEKAERSLRIEAASRGAEAVVQVKCHRNKDLFSYSGKV